MILAFFLLPRPRNGAKARLKEAEKDYAEWVEEQKRTGETPTDEPVLIERGSGNVFADLELPRPDMAPAKAELVQHIRAVIEERGLTQTQAAKLLRIDQPKVSALVRGRVEGYTLDRLFRFLNALGRQVEISVRPTAKAGEEGAVLVR